MSVFREHYIGGLVAYSAFFIVSVSASVVGSLSLQYPINWNPTISLDPWKIGGCFTIAVLSGLWPDVDIRSKSQSIFYRIFLGFNLILIWREHYIESAFLGIFAMCPLIGKHRGWTHSRFTMLLLPAIFLILPFYFECEVFDWTNPLSSRNLNLVKDGLPFYVASVIGYATHLHLDGILLRSRKAQRRRAQTH